MRTFREFLLEDTLETQTVHLPAGTEVVSVSKTDKNFFLSVVITPFFRINFIYSFFEIYVVFHCVMPFKMIGRNIQHTRDMWAKRKNTFKLKT